MFSFPERTCNVVLRKEHPLLRDGFSPERLWNDPFVDYLNQYAAAYGALQKYINPHTIIRVDDRTFRERILLLTDAYSISILRRVEKGDSPFFSLPLPELKMHLAEGWTLH